MSPLRTTAILALAVPALGLAACGSSSSSDTLDKNALVSKANAICTSFNAKAKAIKPPTNLADPTQAAAYFGEASTLAKQQHAQLAALKPDDAAKAQWNTYIAADASATDYLGQLAAAAKAKDAAAGQKLLTNLQNVATKVTTAADTFGAKVCGSASN